MTRPLFSWPRRLRVPHSLLLWAIAITVTATACTPMAQGGSEKTPEASVEDSQPEAGATLTALPDGGGLVIKTSPYDVKETTTRFQRILEAKGLTLFATIDHEGNAAQADLTLPETRVVIFGNAKLGTPLMQCSPTLAIDLPQKVLIWQEGEAVKLAYNDPQYLAQRHGLTDECGSDVLKKITGALDRLTQEAVEPS